MIIRTLSAVLAAILFAPSADATEFAYRGRLSDGDQAAQGRYDLQVKVYSSENGGALLAQPITLPNVMVTDGRFAVPIAFDDTLAANGERWLELAVREAGSKAAFDVLPAREKALLAPTATCTGAWDLSGNSGNPVGSFLGNTDAQVLELRATGGVGINTNSPPAGQVAIAGDVTLTRAAARSIYVGKEPDNNADGKTLTIKAGDASDSGVPFQARTGGDLLLQAGNGYNASINGADGGDVILRTGANWISASTTRSGGDIVMQTGDALNVFNERMRIRDTGEVRLAILGAAGATTLCLNASNEISTCSSSARYKDHIVDADFGLATIAALRPVRFEWKETHAADLGLVAEEVAGVEPALATRNAAGKVEGVKYDRLAAVLVKAMQEQQVQLQQQQKEIATLRLEQQRLVQLIQQVTVVGATAAVAPSSTLRVVPVTTSGNAAGGNP